MTKKDVSSDYTEQCQETFLLLKESLMKEPILKYLDAKKPYVLFTDIGEYALACVLTQFYEYEIDEKNKFFIQSHMCEWFISW